MKKLIAIIAVLPLLAISILAASAQQRNFSTQAPLALGSSGQPNDRGSLEDAPTHHGSYPLSSVDIPDDTFVADTGEDLDQYLFQSSSPLIFHIYISRYYESVAEYATLTMRIWDVDSWYPGWPWPEVLPEVDTVSVNGHLLPNPLTGSNDDWSTYTYDVRVEWLNFPSDPGEGGTITPAANEIRIDIDTLHAGVEDWWAVEVDWGELKIPGARPVLLVHGFDLFRAGPSTGGGTWNNWEGYLKSDGIPYQLANVDGQGDTYANGDAISAQIEDMKNRFGVKKVNVVGFSKGGLDTRASVTKHNNVDKFIILGSPNAGTILADLAMLGKLAKPELLPWAEPALHQLTTWYVNLIFNRKIGRNHTVEYYALAGDWRWLWGVPVNPIFLEPNDGVVAVSSVEVLPYTTNLPHFDYYHGKLNKEQDVYNTIKDRAGLDELSGVAASSASSQVMRSGHQLETTFAISPTVQNTNPPPIMGIITAGEVQTETIDVDPALQATFSLLWSEGDLGFALYDPNNQRIDPTVASIDPNIAYVEDVSTPEGKVKIYIIDNPLSGNWRTEVTGVSGIPGGGTLYFIMIALESNLTLSLSTDESLYQLGAPILITAEIMEDTSAVTGATVTSTINPPTGTIESLTLYDDGAHSDGLANDGVYAATYTNTTNSGHYQISATASGTTSGVPFSRSAFTGASVSPETAAFNDTYSDQGLDTDGDGLFNFLAVDVGVNALSSGDYRAVASLTDSAGNQIDWTSTNAHLTAGGNNIRLQFNGRVIAQSGVDGPYYVKELFLFDLQNSTVQLDYRAAPWTTASYSYLQFQRYPVTIIGNYTDQGLDTDSNGLFDALLVRFDVNVTSGDTYVINARLVDSNNEDIVWASTRPSLPAGTSTVELSFDGNTIGTHGVNGPYYVKDLSVYSLSNPSLLANISEAYTTGFYSYLEFEGAVTDIIQVTTAPEDDWRSAIARTSDGRLWVVWDSWRSDNNIWYKTSDDNGVTWSADTQFTTDPSSDYDPVIMQASDGTIWVAWYSYRSGNADIWYKISSDGGVTWSAVTQLTTDPSSDYSPAITQASDGTIWVVWHSYRSGNADLWYKTSSDGGASWSADTRLTTDPAWDENPSIAQTGDGTIWVLWHSWRTDHPAIWYKTSTDGGASWSPDAEFNTDTNWDYMPTIAQTSDGTIWVARMSWSWDLWNFDIWYKTSNDGGVTWSADQQFTQFTGWDEDPGLAALPSDQVALVWSSDRAVNYDIWFGIIGVHGDVNPPPHLDEIEHDPWPNPDSNDLVTIRADVSDETGIASVIIKWWEDGTPQADLTMYDDGAHGDHGADDGWYGVQIGPFPVGTVVEYQVEITDVDGNTILASQYPMRFESLEPFVKTADILFVPDNGGYDTGWFRSYYEDALGMQGYQYDVWDTGLRGEIDSATLNQYTNSAVIWAAPGWGFVTSSDYTRNTLQSFLDNGGNLFITGQDIGFYAGGTSFYQDYLHASYVQDDPGLRNLEGVAGDPISDGLSFSIVGGDGADNQYYPDEIDPVSPAVTILTYSGGVLVWGELRMPGDEERKPFVEPGLPVPERQLTQRGKPARMRMLAETQGIVSSGSGAIRVDTGTYKVVYFAFGFEGINATADRNLVMRRVMAWFGLQPGAGILLEMKNQANEHAADAMVEAYSDASSWPDFRSYTDPYGSVWVGVPNGTYTLVVSSGSDNFIIVKQNVSAPSSPTLDTTGTVSVYVEARKLDGTPLSAPIYFDPYWNSLGGVGSTDASGHLAFNATLMTYNAFAWSWSELYYLSKPDTTVSGSTVTFYAAEMDTGQINVDLLDFVEMTLLPFGSYTNWGPVFHVNDGSTVVLSADAYYIYNELVKNNTSTWYYEIDTGDNPYTITAGSSRTIEAGGDFTVCMMPDKSFYNAGEDVNISNFFTDAFGNEITWVSEYTSGQGALGEPGVGTIRSVRENGARDKDLLKGEVQMSSWSDVCPTITVKDPNNQTIVDENSCGIWWGYQFTLSSGATSGVYSVNLSLDTGPHQGVVEGNGHFTVNCIFGDVNCNCEVKVDDIMEVANRWRCKCGDSCYDPLYDINKDGIINVVDIMLVVAHWGETCP